MAHNQPQVPAHALKKQVCWNSNNLLVIYPVTLPATLNGELLNLYKVKCCDIAITCQSLTDPQFIISFSVHSLSYKLMLK